MDEVEQEMMQNILRHVKAPPYPHGPQALRVLGKLAGRNRRFLKTPLALKSVTPPSQLIKSGSFSFFLNLRPPPPTPHRSTMVL